MVLSVAAFPVQGVFPKRIGALLKSGFLLLRGQLTRCNLSVGISNLSCIDLYAMQQLTQVIHDTVYVFLVIRVGSLVL